MADPLVLAYLAGVVDSDGFVSIHRSTRRGAVYHAPVVGIAGTRREPHDLAASVWGGNVWVHNPGGGYRPQFQWARQGKGAALIIADLAPFLRVKRDNAQLALDLFEHVQQGHEDDPFPWLGPDFDPVARRDAMRAEMVGLLNVRHRT